jgi:hypothetical protein
MKVIENNDVLVNLEMNIVNTSTIDLKEQTTIHTIENNKGLEM